MRLIECGLPPSGFMKGVDAVEGKAVSPSTRTDPRYIAKIATALVIYVLFQFVLPPAPPITREGMGVLGVFLSTIFLWVTVGTGWASLLCVGMYGLTGVTSASGLFSATWGNVMVPFVVACFLLNNAMAETGLTHRFALWFITRPGCKGRPWRIMFMFFLSITLITLVSTSSPIVIMYMAIAEEIFISCGYEKGDKFSKIVMISIFFVCQGAMCNTPISHVLIPMIFEYIYQDFGIVITTFQYSKVFMLYGIYYFAAFWLIFRYLMKPDVSKLVNLDAEKIRAEQKPMSREERVVLAVFMTLVFFWLAPDLLALIPGLETISTGMSRLGQGIPALVAVGVLASVKLGGKPVLDINAANKKVIWNTVYMMAAVMGTGYLFGLDSSGIKQFLLENIGPMMIGLPPSIFVFVALLGIIIMTSFLSNTLSAAMYTVIIPIAQMVSDVNPIALGLCIAAAVNIADALPSGSPAASMASGSGWTPVSYQIKYGFLLALISLAGFYFIAYPLCSTMFPV